MTTIQCEICLHKLATVEGPLSLPLAGAMFSPPDPWMPPPFAADLNWEWMRCPMCGKRPFTQEGRFLIFDQAGFLDIAEGCYRDPETGMLTMESVYCLANSGRVDAIAAAAASLPGDATVTVYTGDMPAGPDDEPTGEKVAEFRTDAAGTVVKAPTVLDEVYRLADAGMKPGQISAELAKAGVVLHHVTIAQKLRARATT